jgi:tetratricopeptide (TPR) repeat protein
MKRFVGIALLATTLCATGARAFELCDVEGKSEEFAASIHPLYKLANEKRPYELDSGLNAMLAAHEAGRMPDALVHRVFEGFSKGYADLEPLLREWVAKFPRSQAAWLALAYNYTGRGWAARGSKYGNETSREQIAEAEQFFRQALKAYDKADALTKKPTLSIAQRINIAAGVSTLGLDASRLYHDAIGKYPDTLQVRIRYIDASRPKWGGSVKQLESIIDDAKPLPAADRRYIEYLVGQEIAVAYWCAEPEGCAGPGRRKGQNAKSVTRYLEKSVPLCPGLDRAAERLMAYQTQTGDHAGVIATATRLIQRKPRSAEAFTQRGMAYAGAGKYKEAFADYERASQLGDFEAFRELAWFHENGKVVPKDVAKAIDYYLIADSHDVDGARERAEKLAKEAGVPLK